MDNPIDFYGFRPHSTVYGAAKLSPVEGYVATGYQAAVNGGGNVDLNIGDPVRKLSTGYYEIADGNEGGGGGETIFGIIVGIKQYYDGTRIVSGTKLPGGTAYGTVLDRKSIILVQPVQGMYFEVACDDAATATTEAGYIALIGEECDHRLADSSSRANPRLDISTHGTGSAQWQIRGISGTLANKDFAGLYVKLIVECTEPQVDGV